MKKKIVKKLYGLVIFIATIILTSTKEYLKKTEPYINYMINNFKKSDNGKFN